MLVGCLIGTFNFLMNKLTGFAFILMVVYLFAVALYALVNHANNMLGAGLTRLNMIASTVFDVVVAIALIALCASICVFIYKRIKK